jgi:hypothetical protein
MVMLWSFVCLHLIDAEKRKAKVVDLAVSILEGDYPPVTHVFFGYTKQELGPAVE